MPPAAETASGLRLNIPRWLYFVVFTVSGFSGLIYESIWSHYLKLFLGHAAYAQSLVLSIFMGGMALGAWLASKYSHKLASPVLAYAIVEIIVGGMALVFHNVFDGMMNAFYQSIFPAIDSVWLANALKWSAAALLIIPQSILLGMTFPLMTAGVLRRYPDTPGGSLAMLYFTNSIGAAAGVLASGFWLIKVVGLPGAVMTAGLLNIAVALSVWILVKLDGRPAPAKIHAEKTSEPDVVATLFLLAAFITGAASFIYEISWIRMLSLVLGATTHSFELMLSAFITGLAFGGLWIKRRIDRIQDPVKFSGWVQLIMGMFALLTLPILLSSYDWMAYLIGALQKNASGYVGFTLGTHAIALMVMLPTTFMAGMTLPLFTHVIMRKGGGEKTIGRVYACNTVGAIFGVIVAVHILLPLLGVKGAIIVGAGLDIVLGAILLARAAKGGVMLPRHSIAVVVCGISVVLTVFLVNFDPARTHSGVFRHGRPAFSPDAQVRFAQDGKTASVAVIDVGSGHRAITTNGKTDAAIQMDNSKPASADEMTMVLAGVLPLAYKPDAKIVGNIGFGSGLTTHTMLGASGVERVDTVEIEAAMVEGAKLFGEAVARAYTDPRSHIHIEDAKTYFATRDAQYDVIVAEPSNPWVSGVASLFSEEFYRTVGGFLKPDGVFVQWLQLYEFNNDLMLSVLKALSPHFRDYTIYAADYGNILIVATQAAKLPTPDYGSVFNYFPKQELERVGLVTASDFWVRKLADRRLLKAITRSYSVPANSDYFPFLDLNAGRARYLQSNADLFVSWSATALPLLEMLGVRDVIAEQPEPAAFFFIAQQYVLVDELLGESSDRPEQELLAVPVSLREAWDTAQLIANSCEFADEGHAWLRQSYTAMTGMLAFTTPEQARQLVDHLSATACEAVPALVETWRELYYAIAERDARRMSEIASDLLEQEINPEIRTFVIETQLLGNVAAQRYKLALESWQQHKKHYEGRVLPSYLVLLLSLAEAHTES